MKTQPVPGNFSFLKESFPSTRTRLIGYDGHRARPESLQMPIAFYAPLKSPDHPVPSGDRQMARLLLCALKRAGYDPQVASSLRAYLPKGDRDLDALMGAAKGEAEELIAAYKSGALPAPDLWFTYHGYYKSPDLLGPVIAKALQVPYVTAESSHAGKRADGPWARAHLLNQEALERSDLNFCFTERDREGVLRVVQEARRVSPLPPFLDVGPLPERAHWEPRAGAPVRLLTVAMMRPDVKLESYRMLADALSGLEHLDWSLDIAGDGEARPAVEHAFAALAQDRVTWHGRLEASQISALYAQGELYVWPGFGEAYGMAFLEAQACGLAVVAQNTGGIASVVEHGRTGLLTVENDVEAFAAAIAELIQDRGRLAALGRAAHRFVRGQRSIESASARLKRALEPLL